MTIKNPFNELGLAPAAVKAAGYERCMDLAQAMYRQMSKYRHPDVGGSAKSFAALEEAMRFLEDPSLRKEFYDEYVGKLGEARLQQVREQNDSLKLELNMVRERLSQAIGAPFSPGSIQNLTPGTLLLISDHPDWILLRADEAGVTMQYLEEGEAKRQTALWDNQGTGRSFIVTHTQRAFHWDQSKITKAEAGFWLAAPAGETKTQYLARLEPIGKAVAVPFDLIACLGYSVVNRNTADTQRALNASVMPRSGVGAAALSDSSAQALSFRPELGATLIISRYADARTFQPLGTIQGGLIPQP